jgi:hypothetical protein
MEADRELLRRIKALENRIVALEKAAQAPKPEPEPQPEPEGVYVRPGMRVTFGPGG